MSDLISRSALIERIVNTPTEESGYNPVYLNGCATRQNEIIEIINEQPTVEPVRGEWVEVEFGMFFKCSICGYLTDYRLTNYCPNCGADMGRKVE